MESSKEYESNNRKLILVILRDYSSVATSLGWFSLSKRVIIGLLATICICHNLMYELPIIIGAFLLIIILNFCINKYKNNQDLKPMRTDKYTTELSGLQVFVYRNFVAISYVYLTVFGLELGLIGLPLYKFIEGSWVTSYPKLWMVVSLWYACAPSVRLLNTLMQDLNNTAINK